MLISLKIYCRRRLSQVERFRRGKKLIEVGLIIAIMVLRKVSDHLF
jgi:hypothetical protein